MEFRVNNIALASGGERKILWARRFMPLLADIEKHFIAAKPFAGLKVALSVHVEAKTACLCRLLTAGGADLYATGCNPLSTQDDVAAALAAGGVKVFARHAASPDEYYEDLMCVLEPGPNIIIDDGGDLTEIMHTKLNHLLPGVIGGCEETTTGVRRLEALNASGELMYPVFAVNNARCKYLFDNRYGTGQSVWDGINRTTNLIAAGKNVVIAGYGWCGKGVALRAKGLGAHVYVTEVDPVKALEAHMDGFSVLTMNEAAPLGDLFITVTGCKDVITPEHFVKMKDGAVLCNAGHFNVEVDVGWLESNSADISDARDNIRGYTVNGKRLFVLAEGRLVNLASGDGHPAEIMDMSFAIQALCCERIAATVTGKSAPGVYPVPQDIDNTVAERKLSALGRTIDRLTESQSNYLGSWIL